MISTERLEIHEMDFSDLDFISGLLADPAVMKFYPKTYSRAEAEAWIARRRAQYDSHGYSLWLVLERRSGEPVGQVGLLPQTVDGDEEDEIGYLLASDHWRRGYATEAAAAVRDFAFGTLRKERLVSLIRPVNERSQAVARRIGMSIERTTVFAGFEHLLFTIEATAGA